MKKALAMGAMAFVVAIGARAADAGILAMEIDACRSRGEMAWTVMYRRQAGVPMWVLFDDMATLELDERMTAIVSDVITQAYAVTVYEDREAAFDEMQLFERRIERECIDEVVQRYDHLVLP